MADVNITVDGKKITAPAGTLLIEACKSAGIESPVVLLLPRTFAAGRVPHVPGGNRKDAEAADGLHHRHPGRHGGHHRRATKVRQARKAMLEMLLQQPSARLPGVRRRRRVRTAGHDVQLRRRRVQVHRHQEPPRRAAVVAGGVLRPPALHPVLPLRARLRRRHGRVGAGHPEPRPALGDRAQPGRPPGVRRVRHVHRHLPGRRADLRRVPLQDAALGDEPRRHRLHALRRWLQDHAGRAPRSDTGMEIVRGDNRDKSGINGDFLCIKGRYAFDFADHPERLKQPLVRANGKLAPATWEEALELVGAAISARSRRRRRRSPSA